MDAVKGLCLLTSKPMIYAANVAEDDLADNASSNEHVIALKKKAVEEACDVVIVSAQVRYRFVYRRKGVMCTVIPVFLE